MAEKRFDIYGLGPAIQAAMPTGGIIMVGATGIDFGDEWLYCEGQEVSRETYAALYAAIGDTYGAGDGTTTFLLPNAKKRVPVGHDPEDDDFEVGVTGGENEHMLTTAEMPAHSHSGTTSTNGSHRHDVPSRGDVVNPDGGALQRGFFGSSSWGFHETEPGGSHNHTLNVNDTGSGEAHNNMQQYIVFPYIIKT